MTDSDNEIRDYLRRADAEVRALRNLRNDLKVAQTAYLSAIEAADIDTNLYRHKVEDWVEDAIKLVKDRLEQAERTAAFD